MSGVNRCHFIGRLGKNPETRHLENGNTVTSFSIAVGESYKDKKTGERKEQTEWVNIVLWSGLAEVAEKYLNKGDQVYIEGKLRTRSWEHQGVTKYTTEVVADSLTMLGGSKQERQETGQKVEPESYNDVPNDDDSELPF